MLIGGIVLLMIQFKTNRKTKKMIKLTFNMSLFISSLFLIMGGFSFIVIKNIVPNKNKNR